MYTNADCTLYLYGRDGKTETYTRVPVEGVYWEDVRQATFLKTGQQNAVAALVVIPAESLEAPLTFTQGRDLIVKGIVDDEVKGTDQAELSKALAALKSAHNFLTVLTVDERLYGSESVQHYELSCK